MKFGERDGEKSMSIMVDMGTRAVVKVIIRVSGLEVKVYSQDLKVPVINGVMNLCRNA